MALVNNNLLIKALLNSIENVLNTFGTLLSES